MSQTYSEMSSGRQKLAIFALIFSAIGGMMDMVVTPLAANLYEVFADSPEALVSFGITGGALVGLPFLFVAGKLCDKFDKRIVLIISFIAMSIFTLFGAVVENVWWFVIMRIGAGITWSFTNTASLSLLGGIFNSEEEHGKVVGWYNFGMSIAGAVLSFGAGQLAMGGWAQAYWMYILIPIATLLLFFFCPKCPPVEGAKEEESAKSAEPAEDTKGWWKALMPLVIQVFLVAACYFVLLYMGSLFVEDAGVGDVDFAGTMASVMTLTSALGSLVFGALYSKMKNAVYFPGVIVIAIGFFAMAFFPTPVVTMVCAGVMGFCWPFYYCYFYTRATEMVPASKAGAATSLVGFSDCIAMSLSSYILLGVMDAMGTNAVGAWPLFGVVLAVVVVVSLIIFMTKSKKQTA